MRDHDGTCCTKGQGQGGRAAGGGGGTRRAAWEQSVGQWHRAARSCVLAMRSRCVAGVHDREVEQQRCDRCPARLAQIAGRELRLRGRAPTSVGLRLDGEVAAVGWRQGRQGRDGC